MTKICPLIVALVLCLLCGSAMAQVQAPKSRYAILSFGDRQVLREFNDNLRLNRKLRYGMRKKNVVTVADEVLAKVDSIIEKAMLVLDMFPDGYRVRLVLLPDSGAVSKMYLKKYGKRVDHIAYYSLSEKTIYLSADDVNLRVLAHEVGHSVVDYYFKVRPPYTIHELMAQFAEKHITD